MPRERVIVNRMIAALRALGCIAMKVHGSAYGTSGIPDLYVYVPVRFQDYPVPLVIEVKQPGEAPTKIQQYRLAELRRIGVVTLVATHVEEVRACVRRIRKEDAQG